MKNFIKIFSLKIFLLLFLLCPGPSYGNVKIDAVKTYGTVSEVLSSSIWLHHLNDDDVYPLGKFLKDNSPRVVQLSLTTLQRSKSFDDYKGLFQKYLGEAAPSLLVRQAGKQGFRVVIGFDPCPMPSWLSARAGDKRPASNWGYSIETCSPPADFKLWARVVRYTLKSFMDRGVKNLGIYVGHEQEREWIGDEKSFFKYYEYAARAAKGLDKSIAVGGPGAAGHMVKRLSCSEYPAHVKAICDKEGGWSDPGEEAFIKNFIDYAATNGEGSKRVPLDFINWHQFGANTETLKAAASTMNGWLKENNLKGVKLYPADWSGWTWPPYPADYLDTAEFASFIPQALQVMWDSGIQWHGHDFNVFSGGLEKEAMAARKASTFIGDWGLFTRHGAMKGGIIKPSYNVFKLFSMMAGEKNQRKVLMAKLPDYDTVKVFSTRDKNGLYMLVSNYVPRDKRFQKFFAMKTSLFLKESGKEKEAGWVQEGVKGYAAKKKYTPTGSARKKELLGYLAKTAKCTSGKDPEGCEKAAAKGLEDPVNKEIREGVSEIVKAGEPREIILDLENLGRSGKASLISYTVDDSASNACAYNKRTEPRKSAAPCGIGGAVDKKVMASYKAASAAGKKAAKEELVKWFGPDEAKEILRSAQNCKRKGSGMKKCLKKSASKDREKGMRATVKRYKRVKAKAYYKSINTINNLPEVSVEGSRKVEKISVQKGKAEIKVTMNPNSVMLLILKKDSGDNAKQ